MTAFTVDQEHVSSPAFDGLPVRPFEEVSGENIYVAVVYGDMNRLREKKYKESVAKNCIPVGFDKDFLHRENPDVGEHTFIFEDNTIQPFTSIGNNCVLWSGNHTGHHSRIGNNVFISSHCVISGNCEVGDNTFIGVNSTVADGVKIGKFCWISPGSVVTRDVPDHSLVRPSSKSEIVPLDENALKRALMRKK